MNGHFTAWLWLGMLYDELLLFAAVWLAIWALDEWAMDTVWAWLRISGRVRTLRLVPDKQRALQGVAAVLVPAWAEAKVVGAMVDHCLRVWPHRELRLYVGCYRNDPATLASVMRSAHDPRLRIVVHDRDGPTTKADCLNRLYAALCADEARAGAKARSVIVHDATDVVHPLALGLLDAGLERADIVQLPLRPEPQAGSRWVAGHYCDEFAEDQAKTMVVRSWLGSGVSAVGTGCAISRAAMATMAAMADRVGQGDGPFARESLTEQYEFALGIAQIGGVARFLRVRDAEGRLVATRKFFPGRTDAAVRQKTRWLHGIALQGWERMGWGASLPDLWMRLRDRRGPMAAMVLAVVYLLLVLSPVLALGERLGWVPERSMGRGLTALLRFDGVALAWRMVCRGVFTAREYGMLEGVRAIARTPVRHAIAMIAARRAILAYLASVRGRGLRWDHVPHHRRPARRLVA